jgi:hypothetical protein
VISGSGTCISLLGAIVVSASGTSHFPYHTRSLDLPCLPVFSQPGCRDPFKDPHFKLGDKYRDGLKGWCVTKKATAVFLWLLFCELPCLSRKKGCTGRVRGSEYEVSQTRDSLERSEIATTHGGFPFQSEGEAIAGEQIFSKAGVERTRIPSSTARD